MAVQINVQASQAALIQSIAQGVTAFNTRYAGQNQLNLQINSRSFSQPLGRITSDLADFESALKASNARVLAFGASTAVLGGVVQTFKEIATTTVEVEKSLTDINRVLNLSTGGLQKFSTDLFGIAQQTSSSFQDAAKAALEFSRQGLGAEQTLKRTADAMTLVRLTGIDSARAVEDLTATVNGFSKSGLTTSQIVNKLAAVEQDFAVSATDLTEALSRTGQAAQESGVGFDQLNALVTAAQESTARGGAVIGNALKTIFTRLQRTETLDQLENFNIAVRDIEGNILPAVQILQNFAGSYNNLADAQRAQLAEQVAGVYQVNILKSIINDLNNSQGTYVKSLERGSMASNEAQIANEKLNQTLSALVSQTGVGLQQLANNIGKVTFEPIFKSIVSPINDAVQYINETLEGEGPGSVFANGILKGIRNVITGPGLAVAFAVIAKVAKNTFEDATKALPAILGLTTEAQKRANVEQSILRILQGQGQISQALIGQQGNSAAQAQLLLNLAKAQTAQYQQQLAIAQQLASTLVGQGVTVGSRGLQVGPKIKSAGHIPEASAHAERMGAMAGGYKPGKVIKAPSSIGNAIMNSAEKVKYVPGFAQPFINPPANSKAGRAHRKNAINRTGIDPYMANGFIPNFSNAKNVINTSFLGKLNELQITSNEEKKEIQRVADLETTIRKGKKIEVINDKIAGTGIRYDIEQYKGLKTNKEYREEAAKLALNGKIDQIANAMPQNKKSLFNGEQWEENLNTLKKQNIDLSNIALLSTLKLKIPSLSTGENVEFGKQFTGLLNALSGEAFERDISQTEKKFSRSAKGNARLDFISTDKAFSGGEAKLGNITLGNLVAKAIESTGRTYENGEPDLINFTKPIKLFVPAKHKLLNKGFIPNFAPPTSAIRVPWFRKFGNPAFDAVQPTLGISKASDTDTFRSSQFRSKAFAKAATDGDPNIFAPLYEDFIFKALQLVSQPKIKDQLIRGYVLQPGSDQKQSAFDAFLGDVGLEFKGFPKGNLTGSISKNLNDKYERYAKANPTGAAKIKESIIAFNEIGDKNQLPSDFGKNFSQLAGTSYSEMVKNNPDLVKALSVETNNLLNSYVKNPAFARMEASSGFIPNFAGKEIATKFFRTKTGFGELFPSEGTGLSGTVYKKSGYKLYGYQLKEHLNNMVMAILGNNVFIPDASYINPRTTTDVNKAAESSARVAALRLSSGGKTAPIGLERGMMSEAFGNAKYVFNPNAVYTGEVSGRMKRVNYDRLSDVLGVFWSQNPETKSAWESLKNASETGKYEKKEDVKAKTTILKNAYNKWLSANQYIGTRVKLSDYRQGVEGVRGANYAALRSDLAGVSNLQNLGEAEKIEKLKKQGVFYGDYKNNKASYDKLGRWSYDAASKKMFLNHAGFIPNFADGLGGTASLMRQALGLMPFVVDLKRGTYAEGDMFHYEIANKKFLNPETKKPIYGTLSPEDIHGSRYADTLVRGFYNASTGKVDFELTETQKKDKDFMKRNSTLLDKVKARYADRFKSSIPVKAKRVSPLSAFRNDGFIPNFADPKYITETLKRIKAGTSGFSAQEQQEFLSKFGTQKTMVASKQQVLKSKMLMSRMVDKLGLDYINSRTVDQLNKDVKNGYMSGALNFDVPENLSFIAAKGFVPNFAYKQAVMALEEGMSGKNAILDTTTGPFPFIRNSGQSNFASAVSDHGGLKNALSDSMRNQEAAGLMSNGFVPNFAVVKARQSLGADFGSLSKTEQTLFLQLNIALTKLAKDTTLTSQQQQALQNTIQNNALMLQQSTKSINIVNDANNALVKSLQENAQAQSAAAQATRAASGPRAAQQTLSTRIGGLLGGARGAVRGRQFDRKLGGLTNNIGFTLAAPMVGGFLESAIGQGKDRSEMGYGQRLASTGASAALTGLSTGAAIGSAIPGIGTAAGAAIGAIVGFSGAMISAKTTLDDLTKSIENIVSRNQKDIELAKTIATLENQLASEKDPLNIELLKIKIAEAAEGIKNQDFAEAILKSSKSVTDFDNAIKEFTIRERGLESLSRIPTLIQSFSKETKTREGAFDFIGGFKDAYESITLSSKDLEKRINKINVSLAITLRPLANEMIRLEKAVSEKDPTLKPIVDDIIKNFSKYTESGTLSDKLQPLVNAGAIAQNYANKLVDVIKTGTDNPYFEVYLKNLEFFVNTAKKNIKEEVAQSGIRTQDIESLKRVFAKINNEIQNALNETALQLMNIEFKSNIGKLNIEKIGGIFDTAASAIGKNLESIAKAQFDALMVQIQLSREAQLADLNRTQFEETRSQEMNKYLAERQSRVSTFFEKNIAPGKESRDLAAQALAKIGSDLSYDFKNLESLAYNMGVDVENARKELIRNEEFQKKSFLTQRSNTKTLFDLEQSYAKDLRDLKKKTSEEDLKLEEIKYANLLKEKQIIQSFNLANQTIQNRTQAEITAMTIPMEVNPNFFAGMSRFQQEDYKFRLDVEKERKQLASNIRTATNEATLAQFQQKILISNTDATYENTKAIRESTIELLKQRLDKSVALESRLKDIQPKIQEQAQEQTQIQAQTEIAQAIASIIPAQESLAQSYRNTFEQDNDLYPLRTNILPDLKSEYEYNDAHIEEFLSKRKRDDESIRKMSQEYSDSLEREVKKGSALEILTSTEKLVDYLVSAVDKAAETFVNYYNTPAQSLPQRIPVTQQNFNREQAKNSSQRIPIAQQNFSGRGQPIVYLNQNSATDEILKNKTSNARNTEVPQKIDQQVQTNPLAEISGNEISNAKNRVVSQNIKIKLESDLIRDQIAALESLNKPSLSPKSNVADVEPNISKLLSETKEYENLTTQIIELERSKQLISEELTKNQETALLTIEQQEQKASQLKIISEEVRRLEDTREKSLNKIVELRRKEAEYVKFIESRGKIGTGIRKATADMSSDIEMFGETLGGTITTSFRDGLVGAMNAAANETDNLENALLGVAANFLKAIQGAMFTQIANQITTSLFPTGPVNAAPTATLPGSQRGGIIRAQTGGFIRAQNGMYISGGRTGDKNPALLEDGEYVLNRNAVKAMGGPRALDRLNFNIAPRFAAGGDPGSISAAIQLAEPYSRLSAFGRENSPEYQAYMDRLREEEAARQQKKAQRKALVRQFVGTLISTGITMGITQGFSAMKESAAANANLKGATGSLANGTTTDVTSFADAKNLINSGGSVKLVDGSVLTKSNFGTAGISKSTFNEIAASRFAASGIKVTPSGGLFGKTNYTVEKTGASGPNYGMKATRSFNNPYEAFSARNAFTPGYQSVNSNFGSFYNPSFPKIGGRQEGGLLKFNSGGFLPYGNRLNDTIPALLSGGEYVVNSRAVKKYGVGGMNRINAGVAKFQEGGLVDSSVDMNTPSNTTNTSNSNISINITVNANNNGKTDESQDSSGEGTQGNAKELSNRIKAVVLEVISTEQRTGGLLDSTKKK